MVEGLDDRHDAIVGEAKIAERAEREGALDEVLRALDAADLDAAAVAGEAELLARRGDGAIFLIAEATLAGAGAIEEPAERGEQGDARGQA